MKFDDSKCLEIFLCMYLLRIKRFSWTNAVTVCNLRMVLEKVRFDTRRSLKPFKDLKDRFDPLTPLTKCSPTVHVFYAI